MPRPKEAYDGGLRAVVSVAGDRGRVRVECGLVSTGTGRVVVTPEIAARVSSKTGPVRCTAAAWAGREICGKTVPVRVAVARCKHVPTHAIVADLPAGVNAVVGLEVLWASVERIKFERGATIVCRVQRPGTMKSKKEKVDE